MKTPRITNSMTYIEDDLIAEIISETPHKKSSRPLRWCAIAACFFLLVGTVAVAATIDYASTPKETQPDFYPHEEGYDLRLYIDRIPTTALKGGIQEVPAILRKKMEKPDLSSSLSLNSFLKKFASLKEAEEYIGLDILQVPDWDWGDAPATVYAHSNDESGEIAFLYLEQFTRTDNVGIQYFAYVYTEHWGSDVAYHRAHDDQSRTFTESFYTTKSGLQCHIISASAMESGYLGMSGFIVQDGIKYHIHVSFLPSDAERAEEILHQLADQFK